MHISIVYQDSSLVVIDKPSGIVVNKAQSVKGETIQDWTEKNVRSQLSAVRSQDSDFYKRSGIVHRLDKETSGLLLIAKTARSFLDLQSQFKKRIVKKRYIALVHGMVKPESGEINTPLGRLPWRRERFGVLAGGKKAITKYQLKRTYRWQEEIYSFIEVYPQTGRTHQIRVHLKYINHPLVSDKLYVGRKTYHKDKKWCPRLFLHAANLTFKHPKEDKMVSVESKLPDDLKNVVSKMV